jgi:hypothetical protein
LRDTTWRGRDVGQVKLAEKVVVLGHRALSLEHLDPDSGLVVYSGRKNLRLLGGHNRVTATARSALDPEGSPTHINLVMTPPVVSIPRVKGQTSMRRTPSLPSSPLRIPPWTAAP